MKKLKEYVEDINILQTEIEGCDNLICLFEERRNKMVKYRTYMKRIPKKFRKLKGFLKNLGN